MSLESPGAAASDDPTQAAQPGPGAGQRRRLLDDPRTIRALAHPTRLALISIVGRSAKITAADAARELGVSHALAVHHLRQLAKYGFVEQVEGADQRERPWRAVHTSLSVEGIEAQPGGTDALAVLEQVGAESGLEELGSWQQIRASWPQGWRTHSGVARSTVYLTEDELGDLMRSIEALILGYVEQRPLDDLASRPAGSKAVTITQIVAPQAPTAGEH
jgi:DNA-binding transcriptional ArsR family regulator